MADTNSGLEFDPGFGPYVLAFRGTVDYLYADINRFKNFSQRKTKFMQYHKKILEVFYNNIGFYTGCLMWAAYIKAQPEQKILSNGCYGAKYVEQENIIDTQYMLKFIELFPKDMNYFLKQEFKFELEIEKLVKVYEEFLKLNEGFTKTKLNSDVIVPTSVKINDISEYKKVIYESIEKKDLSILKTEIKNIL